MAFSTFNSFHSSLSNVGAIASLMTIVEGYTFRIKGTTSAVPAKDICGNQIINTGSTPVTMYQDTTRGYVFNFTGVNTLAISATTPISCTRTFWLSIPSTSSSSSYIFASPNTQIIFDSLQFTGYMRTTSGQDTVIRTAFVQGAQWVFYAFTRTPTNLNLYINGILNATLATSNLVADPSPAEILFGGYNKTGPTFTGYLDDMREYPSVLTASQISQIFDGA